MSKNHLHVTCAIIEQKGCVLAAQRSRSMAMPLKWAEADRPVLENYLQFAGQEIP